ncbi:hypothetical protein SDC9_144236 [bioreactor metagenome]|uniref:Uncharacterized protein n=1 Tax=bioreactor metagenome TaxID=1076179 RepID=A0A645E8D0_9ZZZZ
MFPFKVSSTTFKDRSISIVLVISVPLKVQVTLPVSKAMTLSVPFKASNTLLSTVAFLDASTTTSLESLFLIALTTSSLVLLTGFSPLFPVLFPLSPPLPLPLFPPLLFPSFPSLLLSLLITNSLSERKYSPVSEIVNRAIVFISLDIDFSLMFEVALAIPFISPPVNISALPTRYI